MKKPLYAVAAMAAGAVVLAGCGGTAADGNGDGDNTPVSKSISVAVNTDPGSINPITNATDAGQQITAYGYESLLYFSPGTPPVGGLADSWDATTNTVTFTLKEGILCNDGTDLTASDVKGTFDYATLEETGSPYKGVFFPAQGLTIDADDDARTITFTSEAGKSFLAETLGGLPIVCAAGLADPALLETEQLGTGAYALKSAAPGQEYSFDLRPDYTWGPDGVTSDTEGLPTTVTVQVVDSASTVANLLQSGEIQVALVGGSERDRLTDDFTMTLDVPLRPGLIFFNQAEGRPGNDLAVRQGIASAINREDVGAVSSAGRGEQLTTLVSSFGAACTAMDSSASIPAYDLDVAATLLDDAGWATGADGMRSKDGKSLTMLMLYPSKESQGVTAAIELLQTELAKIGVDAVPTPSASYTDIIFSGGDWDMVWAPIYTTLPSDWQGILGGDFPPNGGNWTYNTNQEFFDFGKAAQQIPGEESCDTWQQAQDSLFSNVEVLPVYSSTSTVYGSGVEFNMSKTVVSPITLRGVN